jgi:hypothetical protein
LGVSVELKVEDDMTLETSLIDCAAISSFSQRPLKRNFDFSVKILLELFIFGTSTPRLKLKINLSKSMFYVLDKKINYLKNAF